MEFPGGALAGIKCTKGGGSVMFRRLGLRPFAGLTAIVALFLVSASGATPVTGAAFTTVNEGVDGTGHCQNGNPNVNCNIYDGKQFVWLNGGPSTAYVGDGSYFFAVLEPGGQPGPNDGGAKNLSDDFDLYGNRTFSVSGGAVSYSGSHDFDSNKIRLAEYADTSNPGGVYILAICSLADGYPVTPSKCKYDAFKVKESETQHVSPPTILKDASGSNKKTWNWTITKSVDKTRIEKLNGNATFNYTVSVSHDSGQVSDVKVSGTISVFNPNDAAMSADVSDQLSNGVTCAVTGGSGATLAPGPNDFAYECNLTGLPQGQLDNTATVAWADQLFGDEALAAGSDSFTFSSISFSQTNVDDNVSVSDTFYGALGTVSQSDASPKYFYYSRTVPIPAHDCVTYNNTATFTTDDSGATGSASQSVQACRVAPRTGALTMGFWQNKNGQAIIQAANQAALSAWLKTYHPFSDAPSTNVAGWVSNVIKAATCTSSGKTCNSMLKAQMLATALDVYFSSPSLGGNRINAPAPIGGIAIDLTNICKMIDGTGGVATCSGSYYSVSGAFGGASSLTVLQMLAYQNTADPAVDAGANWYGQVKATQVMAKDAFDAINNQVALQAP
jgi:hypothetical protein